MERIASRTLPKRILDAFDGLRTDETVVETAIEALRRNSDLVADILPFLTRDELRQFLGEGEWNRGDPGHVLNLFRATLLDSCEFDLAIQIVCHLRAHEVMRRPDFVFSEQDLPYDVEMLWVDVSLRIVQRANEGQFSLSKADRYITPQFLRDYTEQTFGLRGLRFTPQTLPHIRAHAERVQGWVQQDAARRNAQLGSIPNWTTPQDRFDTVEAPKANEAFADVLDALRRRRFH